MTEMINIGETDAYVSLPKHGSGAGILLLHAWWGRNAIFTHLADRLAGEGYVVLTPDLNFGEVVDTIEDAKALMGRRDYERIAQAVLAATDALRAHPAVQPGPLGVIGFSMGAAWAIWLSTERPAQVGAVVVYYGIQPADFSVAQAAYSGHFAESDDWEPLDGVQAIEQDMRNAGRDVTLHFYPNTAHWFMESDRPEYDAEAAKLAWQRTLAFLDGQLTRQT